MILIEIGQAIVKVDWRTDIIWNGELKSADSGIFDAHAVWRGGCVLSHPPLWEASFIGRLEGRGELVGRYGFKLICCRGIAVGIVDNQFLDLDELSIKRRVISPSNVLTLALAHSNRPPMGAKMMPIAKRIGRTVLGVRMGLRLDVSRDGSVLYYCMVRRRGNTHCHAFKRC